MVKNTLIGLALIASLPVFGDTLRVDCTPPATRANGAPLSAAEIESYELVTTHSSGELHTYTLSGCGVNLTITKVGDYTAVMHAIGANRLGQTLTIDQRRSAASNRVAFVVFGDYSPPGRITDLHITQPAIVPGR